MLQKYKLPIQLFTIFEKIQIQLWTSTSNQPNHFFIHIPQKWFFPINLFFKRELFFWNSFLVDSSGIDTLNYSFDKKGNNNFFFKNNQIILFYIYYSYFLKIKLTITLFYNNFFKNKIISIDSIFSNSNWIEREVSEMFGINFFLKKDLRKLLVDYSSFDNPLLKSFPTEGYFDIFYNFFDDQVLMINSSVIEL